MALINVGNFDDISVSLARASIDLLPIPADIATDMAAEVMSVGDVREIRADVQPPRVEFDQSPEKRGLAVKSIKLLKSFDLLLDLFDSNNEVYFVAICWDFSGEPPSVFPSQNMDTAAFEMNVVPGESAEYLGQGMSVFGPRYIAGGLNVLLQVWESDKRVRTFGEKLASVSKAVQESDLSQLLSLVALAGGPTTAQLALIKDAGTQLANLIGTVLKANGDDKVDLFAGTYPATSQWPTVDVTHSRRFCELTLSHY